jgi:hypothetical protein
MVIVILIGFHMFKGLATAVAARHAAQDSGLSQEFAKAVEVAL